MERFPCYLDITGKTQKHNESPFGLKPRNFFNVAGRRDRLVLAELKLKAGWHANPPQLRVDRRDVELTLRKSPDTCSSLRPEIWGRR
jgi:hypothetical protein